MRDRYCYTFYDFHGVICLIPSCRYDIMIDVDLIWEGREWCMVIDFSMSAHGRHDC